MKYRKLEEKMRETYDSTAKRYRTDDERDIDSESHCRICTLLRKISASFDRPIRVLEVGCGTGRYFHCLEHVEKLVGIDVSEAMLKEARRPVKEDEITIRETEFIVGNIYTHSFPSSSFDFIYAVGMFGNGCAVTIDLCNKFHDWLTPNGCLFFDAIDTSEEPMLWRIRKRIKGFIYSLLPRSIQEAWDEKTGWLPFFMATQAGLLRLLQQTKFPRYSVEKRICQLTLGPGAKLECLVSKNRMPKLDEQRVKEEVKV